MYKHNFSAGPCILPQEVFSEASKSLLNFNNLNLSVIEISHRSTDFIEVMDEATLLTKELLNIPDGYSVLFLQGGASLQFLMIAINLMKEKGSAVYLDTGTWSSKAIKEAELFGKTSVIASSKEKNYNYIPKNYTIPSDADYFHCTSNNTVYGTQLKEFPDCSINFVCDMSSDIFSRKIDISKFDLIYAGAQKNLGPAGATLVIINNEVLGFSKRKIPTMLDYNTHVNKKSMFNTPPVFSVYVSMLNLRWLKKNGGVSWAEAKNLEKSKLLYDCIDSNQLFTGTVKKEDRSVMNATFKLNETKLEDKFNLMLKENGINGLKGHRSVGGYRASMYNAMGLDSINILIEIMNNLEKKA